MDPTHRSPTEDRTTADVRILRFLIQAEGLSRTIRLLQYAIENEAAEFLLPMNGQKENEATKYMAIVEEIEPVYLKIKDEYKL
jgi:hypothetical protein